MVWERKKSKRYWAKKNFNYIGSYIMRKEELINLFEMGNKDYDVMQLYIKRDFVVNFEFRDLVEFLLDYNTANLLIRRKIREHGWDIHKFRFKPDDAPNTWAYTLALIDWNQIKKHKYCPTCGNIMNKSRVNIDIWNSSRYRKKIK